MRLAKIAKARGIRRNVFDEAEVDFEGNIIKGELPTRARNLLTAWVMLHSDELEAAWELCKNNELPPKIEPLR